MSKQTKKTTVTSNKKFDSRLMNEELKKWLSDSDQVELSKKIKTHLKNKKPHGICQICGANDARVVCIKCGKSVCNSCYFHLVALCENCLSKETVEEWKKKKPDWEKVLGVDWVD